MATQLRQACVQYVSTATAAGQSWHDNFNFDLSEICLPKSPSLTNQRSCFRKISHLLQKAIIIRPNSIIRSNSIIRANSPSWSADIEDVKEPLGIESSIELYILILMGAVCAVAFWELARSCVKAGSSAVRLRALSSSSQASKPKAKPKSQARTLTKAECRELSSL